MRKSLVQCLVAKFRRRFRKTTASIRQTAQPVIFSISIRVLAFGGTRLELSEESSFENVDRARRCCRTKAQSSAALAVASAAIIAAARNSRPLVPSARRLLTGFSVVDARRDARYRLWQHSIVALVAASTSLAALVSIESLFQCSLVAHCYFLPSLIQVVFCLVCWSSDYFSFRG